MRKFLKAPLVLATSLLMTACAAAISNGVEFKCPPADKYTKAQEAEAEKELQTLPQNSVLRLFATDYHAVRVECGAAK